MSSTVLYFKQLAASLAIFCVGLASCVLAEGPLAEPSLTIGSTAPAIDIEHWVSDGHGKFEHVTDLKTDTVYVIEFWATWCRPCIASMPHLSETQEKYADKGVQIISISDEDLETVEEFLARDVRGQDDKTYAELTSNYCLTVDPDGSVMDDYFVASGQRGIPCAFIVGPKNVVEWIGHPMEMDEPLAEVVAGTWDRAAFAEKLKEEQERAEAMELVQEELGNKMQKIETLLEDGESEEGLKLLDEIIADEKFEVAKPMIVEMKQQLIIMYVGGEQAVAALKEMVLKYQDKPEMLNQISWMIYSQHIESPVDAALLKTATEAAERAAQSKPENGSILDTLAHLVHAGGDLDRAIELQEKALQHADGQESDIKPFLEELKAEKAAQDK